MKIGIIGLLSNQVATIKAAFPELKIEFLSREREREAGRFAANVSKVVLMTKFISHSVFGAIPVHKRVPVKGGMTDLRRTIESLLNDSPEIAKRAPVATKETAVMATENTGNWNDLKNAKVGERYVFLRPSTMSSPEWKQHVANKKSYYKRQYGIHMTADVAGNKVTIEIENIEPIAKETAPVKTGDVGQQALLWANYVTQRCAAGVPLVTAEKEADEFLAAFQAKWL